MEKNICCWSTYCIFHIVDICKIIWISKEKLLLKILMFYSPKYTNTYMFISDEILISYAYILTHIAATQTVVCTKVRGGFPSPLQWRHNERGCVSNRQPHDCLLNRLFRYRSKQTSKLSVTDHFEGDSSVTGEFPAQMTSNAENVSIWWRHYDKGRQCKDPFYL